MKYVCASCRKTIEEKDAIKAGWFYFCSEKCKNKWFSGFSGFGGVFKVFYVIMAAYAVSMLMLISWQLSLLALSIFVAIGYWYYVLSEEDRKKLLKEFIFEEAK